MKSDTLSKLINALKSIPNSYVHENLDIAESEINGIPCRGLVYHSKSTNLSSLQESQLLASLPDQCYFTANTLRSWKAPWLHRALEHFGNTRPLTDRLVFLMTFLYTLYCQRQHLSVPAPKLFQIYFESMPAPSNLYSPLFYSPSEYELLKGTSIPFMVDAKIHVLENEFRYVLSSFTETFIGDTGTISLMESSLDLDDFIWLDTLFWSRVIELPNGTLCMVPIMDMANHSSSDTNVSWEYCTETQVLAWTLHSNSSTTSTTSPQPLFLNYAITPHNESLFFVHGFCDLSYLCRGPISVYFGDLFIEEMTQTLQFCRLSPMVQFPSPSSHELSSSFSVYFRTMSFNSRLCCLITLLWEYLSFDFSGTQVCCFGRVVESPHFLEDLIFNMVLNQTEWQLVLMERLKLITSTVLLDLESVDLCSSAKIQDGLVSIPFENRELKARALVVNALATYRREIECTLSYLSKLDTW